MTVRNSAPVNAGKLTAPRRNMLTDLAINPVRVDRMHPPGKRLCGQMIRDGLVELANGTRFGHVVYALTAAGEIALMGRTVASNGFTPTQLAKARHALGLDNPDACGTSYRNRYLAPAGDTDWTFMVAAGLAEVTGGTNHGVWYAMTRKGAESVLAAGERLCDEDFPAAGLEGGG